MRKVFDRNAVALLDHDLVGRDRRGRLGGLQVRSIWLDVRGLPFPGSGTMGGRSSESGFAFGPGLSCNWTYGYVMVEDW